MEVDECQKDDLELNENEDEDEVDEFQCYRAKLESSETQLPKDICDRDSESEDELTRPENLKNANRNRFEVTLNGATVEATLDTGSDIAIIGETLVTELKLNTVNLDFEIRVRSYRNQVSKHRKTTTFFLELGGTEKKVRALIVSEAGRNLLVNTLTLYRLGVIWDFRLSTLKVRNKKDELVPIKIVEFNWQEEARKRFPKLCNQQSRFHWIFVQIRTTRDNGK